MLEFRAFEVGDRSGNCGTTQSQGHRCRPQIKQRKHNVEHGRKPSAIVGELKVRRDLAVVQCNGRRSVGPKPKTIPRPRHFKAACVRWNKIQGRIGGTLSLRGKRRNDITVRMTRASHPRLLGAYADAVTIPMCAGYRRPEMTARAGFTESES